MYFQKLKSKFTTELMLENLGKGENRKQMIEEMFLENFSFLISKS